MSGAKAGAMGQGAMSGGMFSPQKPRANYTGSLDRWQQRHGMMTNARPAPIAPAPAPTPAAPINPAEPIAPRPGFMGDETAWARRHPVTPGVPDMTKPGDPMAPPALTPDKIAEMLGPTSFSAANTMTQQQAMDELLKLGMINPSGSPGALRDSYFQHMAQPFDPMSPTSGASFYPPGYGSNTALDMKQLLDAAMWGNIR